MSSVQYYFVSSGVHSSLDKSGVISRSSEVEYSSVLAMIQCSDAMFSSLYQCSGVKSVEHQCSRSSSSSSVALEHWSSVAV